MNADILAINELHAKYANNPYILCRLSKIMENLPNVLQNLEQSRQESQERISVLTAKQQQFIADFMTANQYFYCSTTNLFFKYDDVHYTITTADAIAHHVWQLMPSEEMIHDWQLSTKRFIVKRVRTRTIFSTVPESQTIQSVLETLCPAVFETRDMAKYFLTAMGDKILKKSQSRVCIISAKCAWMMQEFKRAAMTYFGVNAVSGFKHKYGRHDYANCRLLNVSSDVSMSFDNVLDILCVSIHYSERYGDADIFLENHMNDYDTYTHISYLMHRSPEHLVSDFCSRFLEKADCLMRWKHMQYLWNAYLEQNKLPAIMFMGDLKTELGKHIMFDVEMDTFVGVSSRFLPEIDKFLRFWDMTMEISDISTNAFDTYDMDEICALFTKWYLTMKPDANIRERHISENKMRGLIEFYMPNVLCNQGKSIRGYHNVLWDKRRDVKSALGKYKMQTTELSSVSIHDIYLWYSRSELWEFKVSKSYFEKVVYDEMSLYILPGTKKISEDWIRGI